MRERYPCAVFVDIDKMFNKIVRRGAFRINNKCSWNIGFMKPNVLCS